MEPSEERYPEPVIESAHVQEGPVEAGPPRAPAKPRVWSVLIVAALVLPAMILASIVAIVGLLLVSGDLGSMLDPSGAEATMAEVLTKPINLVVLLLTSQAVVLAAALIPAALSKEPMRKRLGLCRGTAHPLAWLLFALATPVFLLLVILVVVLLEVKPGGTSEMLEQTFASASPIELVLLIGTISLAPAICEELFFRGYLLRRLLQRWHPFWALALTTILFGLMHLDLVQGIAVLAFGAWVGVLYWRTGALWPCMACHFANNLVATTMPLLVSEESGEAVDVLVPIAIFGVAGFALVASIVLLALGRRPSWRANAEEPPAHAGYGAPWTS